MKKRIISLFLAVLMVAAILPVAAMAAEKPEDVACPVDVTPIQLPVAVSGGSYTVAYESGKNTLTAIQAEPTEHVGVAVYQLPIGAKVVITAVPAEGYAVTLGNSDFMLELDGTATYTIDSVDAETSAPETLPEFKEMGPITKAIVGLTKAIKQLVSGIKAENTEGIVSGSIGILENVRSFAKSFAEHIKFTQTK